MTEICEINKCTGCGLCQAICPKDAISFKYDELGFRYPIIDNDKCVNCQLCSKQCPSVNPVAFNERNDCYLAWSKDDATHFNSSSGGICYELGKQVILQGGVVVGCVWDDAFNAVFKLIDKVEELSKTVGSKYVQSYLSKEVIQQIRETSKNRKVLFVGLPCQCAALKKLNKDEKGGLIIIDLLCRGGCSPKSLKSHIDYIKKKNRIDYITNIGFRGGEFNCKFTLWNKEDLVYKDLMFSDTYFYAFMKHSLLHESCYQCQYAQSTRVSDMTIADFWGIDEGFLKNKKVLNGHNLLLVHTDKGHSILNDINNRIELYERPLQEAIAGNDTLRCPTPKPIDREQDIIRINKYGFEKAVSMDKGYKRYQRIRRKNKLLAFALKITPNFIRKIVKSLIR